MSNPVDQAARQESLNTQQSYIVQAPAGSGKTSLLTLRFLRLLLTVQNPEEILAITFTRKAAAEMHQRIINSLMMGTKAKPINDFDRQLWQVATEVLEHDALNAWQLLNNPARLRIQTIDSLCASLTQQLPVTARFGSPPSIQIDSSALYVEAARNCLEEMEADDGIGKAIQLLLTHLDNQFSRAEKLISAMLASRDQWLRHMGGSVVDDDSRASLEEVLQRSIMTIVGNVASLISLPQQDELKELLMFASKHTSDVDSPTCLYAESFDFNDTSPLSLDSWKMLADFVLTAAGSWRKQANAALGFPAPSATVDKEDKALYGAMKKQYKQLLTDLADNAELLDAMLWLRCLPSPQYSEQQWQFIQALFVILPRAVAHLRVVFQSSGHVDFCEVSLSASYALHDERGVTDTALKLDYQLKHILVDEFQDTSETQFNLLQDLVAGWQPGDGKTLFLVGDPMQSIYRFRQAEVGLFLKTQQEGLGEVKDINCLNISVNFRSQAGVIDWVNQSFKDLMPEQDDFFTGAISYKPSIAFNNVSLNAPSVNYYPHGDRQTEGRVLSETIQAIQQQNPNETIGVLVRGRKALTDLVSHLSQAGIKYQATDIDPLNQRQVVIDLMSLCCAYLQAADRLAWLAILRAPWSGLSLTDMMILVDGAEETNVWDLMFDESRVTSLSEQGQLGIKQQIRCFKKAFTNRERMSLVDTIKGLWSDLNGPECLLSSADLEDTKRFFECLQALEVNGQTVDTKELKEAVDKLFAATDTAATDKLQIMTIHKAKGLEFDHVILPGLDRQARHDDKALLTWLERPSDLPGKSELLISPLKESGATNDDDIARYITKIEQKKTYHESQRLLYVATTRAKRQLHLSFCLNVDEKTQSIKKPPTNTLLGLLWPSIEQEVDMEFADVDSLNVTQEAEPRYCYRLDLSNFKRKKPLHENFEQPAAISFKQQTELLEFDLSSDLSAAIGTVCHHVLQVIGEQGQWLLPFKPNELTHLLKEQGVVPSNIKQAVDRVTGIIDSCLQDQRCRWILDNTHEDSQFEQAISGVVNNERIQIRLDRSFVDKGVRWIVDYKTSQLDQASIEGFLDQEVLTYRSQLERYASIIQAMDSRPIMLGLYYPEFKGWRAWPYEGP